MEDTMGTNGTEAVGIQCPEEKSEAVTTEVRKKSRARVDAGGARSSAHRESEQRYHPYVHFRSSSSDAGK